MEEETHIPLPRSRSNFVKRALLCAIGLERLALLEVRSGFEHSPDPRARAVAEVDAAREQLAIMHELVRILHSRWEPIPPSERPHYAPCERMAILKLQAHANWNVTRMARAVQLTPNTLARWQRRLDTDGSDALLGLRQPVNKLGDAVTELVQDLHHVAPNKGRRKLADFLMRGGLHLSASTVRRMTKRKPVKSPPPKPPPGPEPPAAQKQDDSGGQTARVVTATRPHHVWHVDISRTDILLLRVQLNHGSLSSVVPVSQLRQSVLEFFGVLRRQESGHLGESTPSIAQIPQTVEEH